MNAIKALNDYFDKTMIRNKPRTNDFNQRIVYVLQDAFYTLNIDELETITYETGYHIVKYLMQNRKFCNTSINRILRYLKRVMYHYDIISTFKRFENLPPSYKTFRRFTHDELRDIIQFVKGLNDTINSKVYKAMVFLLLDSGLRINELLNIKIDNIDFNESSASPMNIYIEDTKTGKPRYAPFSKFSLDEIKELIELNPNREYLFYNFLKDRRMDKEDVKLFYRRLSRKTGIKNIHSHRFRKTFASLLAENGMPVDIIQKLIGHSRITTTMIYIQYDQKYALSKYNQFNNWLN